MNRATKRELEMIVKTLEVHGEVTSAPHPHDMGATESYFTASSYRGVMRLEQNGRGGGTRTRRELEW